MLTGVFIKIHLVIWSVHYEDPGRSWRALPLTLACLALCVGGATREAHAEVQYITFPPSQELRTTSYIPLQIQFIRFPYGTLWSLIYV